ncbi:hypothetical protein XH87_21375 [Bradyrhizobium sp. CCBAU 53415]|nr:hypothetical protein [Bradyrhizobium sp. CCBAU 53415]
MLRDDDLGLTCVQLFDDPVGIKSLVGDQAAEFEVLDQGRDADGVKAMAGEQDEPHQIPKRVGQREDLGGPAALRLADGLTFGPPFAPCAWRWTLTIVASTMANSISGSSETASKIRLKTPAFTQSR